MIQMTSSLTSIPADPGALHLQEDGRTLRANLRRSERMGQLRAYLLILPLLAFLLFTFIIPIANLLIKSVKDPVVAENLPRTAAVLSKWEPRQGMVGDDAYAALAADFKQIHGSDGASKVAMRLNFDEPGMRSLIVKTSRRIGQVQETAINWRERFVEIDPAWNRSSTWVVIKYASSSWTTAFYLKAFDLERDDQGRIVEQPAEQRLYRDVFLRTAWVSLSVSLLCVLLAYPVASFLAALPARISNVLMIFVLLPFWTSFLVRTISWMVILQTNGIFNSLLKTLGISETGWTLIYNRWGVLIAMTHILLPYAILSLYSVMKGIPPIYVRAARSLGAGPVKAFFTGYFPHTVPGLVAAGMLTFILSVGYYITPAIVGGSDDQLISYYIANHVNSTLNWGLAAALATLLLAGVLGMYAVFVRLTGGSGVKLG